MKVSQKTAILLLISILLLLLPVAITHAQTTTNDAQNSLHNAYNAIVSAYNAGVDTSKLIIQLNQAINLTSQAQAIISSNPQQAQSLNSQAQAIAQNVTTQAAQAKQSSSLMMAPVTAAVAAAALIVGGCLVYLYGPKFFWKTWLKLRKNNRVRAKNSPTKTKGLIVTWEQVCAVILGVTVIIALVATVPFFLPKSTSEKFSELGILGPNMQLGDYPTATVAGQPVNLYVYVGNQMGIPMYYGVMIKLGDNNTIVDPASVTPIQQFTSVVPDNGTWTFPVSVTLTQPGLNQRIIFELWIYNQTLNQMQYNQRWGQVWLNVTAPAS
ncbi:MAG: DUF1616 domain-containing protein [Candidatus Bathyarchaeia archaeon]|jgi:hypothetical protein